MPDPVLDDTILLEAARRGDKAAFKQIYDKYATTLYRIAFSGTRNNEDADDLIQECFLAFYQNLNKIERTDNLGAYLYTSLRNRIFDFYARQQVRSQYLADQSFKPVSTPEEVYSILRSKEIQACIKQAVEQMPEKTREVYLLSKEQELSIGEIAALLQRSPQTIKNQLHDATTRIREQLKKSRLNGWLFFI